MPRLNFGQGTNILRFFIAFSVPQINTGIILEIKPRHHPSSLNELQNLPLCSIIARFFGAQSA
jgi:hypothetical protein